MAESYEPTEDNYDPEAPTLYSLLVPTEGTEQSNLKAIKNVDSNAIKQLIDDSEQFGLDKNPIVAGKPLISLVEELAASRVASYEKSKNHELRKELEELATNLQKTMNINQIKKQQIKVRYVKVPRDDLNVRDLVNNTNDDNFKTCCGKKNKKACNLQDVPHGTIIEAVEDELQRRLTAQQRAMSNWAKIGLRVQIVQAFNMLHKLQDGQVEEEKRVWHIPTKPKNPKIPIHRLINFQIRF